MKTEKSQLTHYSADGEFAHYSDGSIAHRHKVDPTDNPLGCKQCYYLVINGRCSKCKKKVI